MTKRVFLAASWLILHAALLLVFRDLLDDSAGLLGENNLPFTAILALVAAAGMIGALVLYREQPILTTLPAWLKALRRHALAHIGVLAAGTVLLLVIWLTPFEFFTTPLQRELLRAYA